MLVVTTGDVPGRVIKETLGLVEGGGWCPKPDEPPYPDSSTTQALEGLIEEAEKLGADAVVALRYAVTETKDSESALAYGTAVKLR